MKALFSGYAPTIGSVFQDFIIDKKADGLSPSTIKSYIGHWQTIFNYIPEDAPIDTVTTYAVKHVIIQMADKGISPNTVRSYTAAMKTFFSWCRKNGVCDVEVKLYKAVETVPETYTADELSKLLARPRKTADFGEFRTWVIISLLVNDGCRAATIRGIQNRDVHLDDGVIYLRKMKSRKVIPVPLCDSLVKILRDYMRVRGGAPDDFLFPDIYGNQMTANCLKNSIRRYNLKRGVHKTGIHAFRHTFARMYLIDCGGDPLKLQRLLGHSTLDMTNHYAKIFSTDLIDDRQKNSPLEKIKIKKRGG